MERLALSADRAPIPRVLASSALVLAPVILIAFEPDGMVHPLMHQLRSLLAVWLYSVAVVAILHVVTELVSAVVDRRGRDGLSPLPLAVGVAAALLAVLAFSVPVAPLLAAVCPGIGGHEADLVLRGTLLGAVYALVGVTIGRTQRAWLAARLSAERAERAAIEARLSAVTARTQPHFLANALNTIAATVREDPARAEALIESLGGLFSHALSGSEAGLVTLEDELDAARSYLSVQAARFGDRLTFTLTGDALTLRAPVPAMSVLTLVENAVLHGLSRPGSALSVSVRATLVPGALHVEVRDSGPGPDATLHRGHGKGLSDLRARLSLLHPDGTARAALAREGSETVARLELPRKTEAEAREASPEPAATAEPAR